MDGRPVSVSDRSQQGLPDGYTSLSTRFIAWVLIGEILFGLAVGITIGMYSARLAAQERRASLERVSRAVVASLMPMIADQDPGRVDAQMESILRTAGTGEIRCIRVFDSTGAIIASSESGPDCCSTLGADQGPFGVFTQPQVLLMPVVTEGLEIGSVMIEFGPYGLRSFLRSHIIAALIVILSVALVSAPWTAWLVLKHVVEPVTELRDGARQLAEGRRDIVLYDGRRDEIGQLAQAFDDLATELKAKEQTLAESYSELQKAYEAEARAKEEIENLNRMKSDFVAVASHELRTPLSVIRVYAEMLEEQEFGSVSGMALEAVTSISSATARLTSIVSDLMDAALLERGLLPLEFERTRVDEVVRDAVRDADTLAAARGVRVLVDGELPEFDAWVDRLRIRQVLDNLLSNAVKYSGGANEVCVRTRRVDDSFEVRVIDRGRGIPEARRDELFKLFGRLDIDDANDVAGLGLGLAISARIVGAHGGSLGYESNPDGRGSVFIMRVPIGDSSRADEETSVQVVAGGDG